MPQDADQNKNQNTNRSNFIPNAIVTIASAGIGFAAAYFFVHAPQIELQKEQNKILLSQLEAAGSSAYQLSMDMRAQTEELAKQTQLAISEKERADREEQRAILAEAQAHQRDIERVRIETKLEGVRTQIKLIGNGFADDLSRSAEEAYRMVTSETSPQSTIAIAEQLVRSRENVREKLEVVDDNTRIIYDATNSLFDQLRNELARPRPRKEALRDLMNRIYGQNNEMISRVNSSVDFMLDALDCRERLLLAHLE